MNIDEKELVFWTNYAEVAESLCLFEGTAYCSVAFYEELGELCGVFAKNLRGDGPVNDDNVLKEIGDVLWNLAVGLKRDMPERLGLLAAYEDPYKLTYEGIPTYEFCLKLYELDDITQILPTLNLIAKRHGGDLKKCAEMNLEKLLSRKARGALRGSGDNR
jgi:NTP pyrophosphatase (non-canonical NTP hydrolase)